MVYYINMNTLYYTTKELSEILGKNPRTIRRWCTSKKLKYMKIGREYLFPKEDYESHR